MANSTSTGSVDPRTPVLIGCGQSLQRPDDPRTASFDTAADPVTLRRVAHSLKSVLQTLGYADHSVCAKALEQTAQQRPWSEALAGWQDLRQRLVQSFGLAV